MWRCKLQLRFKIHLNLLLFVFTLHSSIISPCWHSTRATVHFIVGGKLKSVIKLPFIECNRRFCICAMSGCRWKLFANLRRRLERVNQAEIAGIFPDNSQPVNELGIIARPRSSNRLFHFHPGAGRRKAKNLINSEFTFLD